MAVNFKGNVQNALACMKKLGVKDELIQWLVDQKFDVKLTPQKFEFSKNGESLTVPTTIDTLLKISDNKLPVTEQITLTKQLEVTVKTLIDYYDETHPGDWLETEVPGVTKVVPQPASSALLDALAAAKAAGLVTTPAPTPAPTIVEAKGWPTFDLAKIKSAVRVKLREATKMYQPVHGSSSASRYFVVAANGDLRVAAKLQQHSLAIRIEGPGWEKHKASITEVGFNLGSKDYASLHLAVGDDLTIANKTLGAVLMGLGVPFETPYPNLKVIKDMGA